MSDNLHDTMNNTLPDSSILVHTDAGVTTLTFNRVDKKNSITAAMYGALADALAAAAADAAVRVVVIQGHETVFSAGNDMGDFLNTPPVAADSSVVPPVFRFLHGIADFPKPLIAAVCGPAVGVGTTLLFHCDLVYAGDNAAFAMPFVNLGLCPEAGSSLLVPQMLGYHRAAEALLLGEPFMAEAALEVGLVNRVVPPTEANAYAQAQARKLAAKPISALIETKRLMKAGQAPAVTQQIKLEAVSFGRMLREPAAREAFTAFAEKRRPSFS
jgi:enoyl-CoA hydratase/carnithine racemase